MNRPTRHTVLWICSRCRWESRQVPLRAERLLDVRILAHRARHFLGRHWLLVTNVVVPAALIAYRPHGAPWLLAGMASGVAWRIWDITHRDSDVWRAGWSAGRSTHAAEIEDLIRTHGDDLTAATALDMADLGRDLKETL